jgi:hypothetical protein
MGSKSPLASLTVWGLAILAGLVNAEGGCSLET